MTRTSLHLLWLLVALAVGQMHALAAGSPTETTLVIITCMIGLQTIFGFVVQGGSFLSGSSISLYGILIFAIFPALYATTGVMPYEHKTNVESLIITSSLAGVLQFVILALCPPRRRQPTLSPSPQQGPSGVGKLSAVLFATTLVLTETPLNFVPNATGIIAILLAAVSVIASSTRVQLTLSLLWVILTLSFYVFYIFEGFGRLVLGMVVLGVLSILSLRFSGYFIKVAILVATIPVIILLSYQRVIFLEERRGNDIDFDEGIGSVVGPFTSSAIIINRMLEGSIELSLGSTLFAALVVWIPSALWTGKPPGFGSEIVPVTKPHLANVSTYSDAALMIGEAVWNFGVWGCILWFVLFGIWTRKLDEWTHLSIERLAREGFNLATTCQFTLITLLACGLINMIWGSTHTYTSRLLAPVAILVLLWAISTLLRSDTPQVQADNLKESRLIRTRRRRTSGLRENEHKPQPNYRRAR